MSDETPLTAEEIKEKTDSILKEMDKRGLSDKKFRKAVQEAKDENEDEEGSHEQRADKAGL